MCGNREIVKVKISRIEVVHPDSGNFLMDLSEKISLLFDFSAIQREVWQPGAHPLCVFLIPVKYFHCGGLFSFQGTDELRPVLGQEHMRCSIGANLANELKSYECTR